MEDLKTYQIIIFLSTGSRECTSVHAQDRSSALHCFQREIEKCLSEDKFYLTVPNHTVINPRYIVKFVHHDYLKPREL
jgi:hypothetical protein